MQLHSGGICVIMEDLRFEGALFRFQITGEYVKGRICNTVNVDF